MKLGPLDAELALRPQPRVGEFLAGSLPRVPKPLDMASVAIDLENHPLTLAELGQIERRNASMREGLLKTIHDGLATVEDLSDIGRVMAIDVPRLLVFIRANAKLTDDEERAEEARLGIRG